MKVIKIYDPAMCCSTGVCGPDVDTELVQLAGFLKNLDPSAVKVERYNLSQEPAAYTTGAVADALKEKGAEVLPLVMVDDEIVSVGAYPDLIQLSEKLGVVEVSLHIQDCSTCNGCS